MNGIFNKIHTDDSRIGVPLPPSVEAMTYQNKKKQTNAIDGSKVLPFDQLNAEPFIQRGLQMLKQLGWSREWLVKLQTVSYMNFVTQRKQHLIT